MVLTSSSSSTTVPFPAFKRALCDQRSFSVPLVFCSSAHGGASASRPVAGARAHALTVLSHSHLNKLIEKLVALNHLPRLSCGFTLGI